jgi:hypothetical protein
MRSECDVQKEWFFTISEIVKNFGVQENGDRIENARHFQTYFVRILENLQ